MKHDLRCPKCQGKRIWILERYRIPGESAEGRELTVVPHQTTEAGGGLFGSLRATPKGTFDLFVCHGCGYSELWAQGLDQLFEDPGRGIRFVDGNEKPRTPFR